MSVQATKVKLKDDKHIHGGASSKSMRRDRGTKATRGA
jgi:hypothetical protein